jgi:hypothetical protein
MVNTPPPPSLLQGGGESRFLYGHVTQLVVFFLSADCLSAEILHRKNKKKVGGGGGGGVVGERWVT